MPCICRGLLIDMCMSRHSDALGHEVTHLYAHGCMFVCTCQCTCTSGPLPYAVELCIYALLAMDVYM